MLVTFHVDILLFVRTLTVLHKAIFNYSSLSQSVNQTTFENVFENVYPKHIHNKNIPRNIRRNIV